MISKELQYLDEILKVLSNSTNYSLDLSKLHSEVSGYKIQGDYFEFLYNLNKAKFKTNYNLDNLDNLQIACDYLMSKNLILKFNDQYRISFEGLSHLSKGGFSFDIDNFHTSLRRSLWAHRISWISLILSFVVFCFSLFHKSCTS